MFAHNHKNKEEHKAKEAQVPEKEVLEDPISLKKEEPAQHKSITVNEAEYHKLEKEAAEYKDKYVRLFAEFDNVRKRMDREKLEFIKYANEGLISEFLSVLDDLERSIEAAKANHQDYTAFLKGIEMVMAHIYEMLKKNNVKPIESIGKKFDPDCHEALLQSESDQFDDGVVMEEFQKGYMYGDRVVRTAKVKVAKRHT